MDIVIIVLVVSIFSLMAISQMIYNQHKDYDFDQDREDTGKDEKPSWEQDIDDNDMNQMGLT